MEPTLHLGSEVALEQAPPSVGTIVLFHPPEGAEEQRCGPRARTVKPGGAMCDAPIPHEDARTNFVKRVVAGPGDEIYMRDGHVYRKIQGAAGFVPEPDSYTRPCSSPVQQACDFPTPITPGHWFLLGDNRGESDDSRWWGPVPTAWIRGVVTDVDARYGKGLISE